MKIYGHRGAKGEAPENTLEGFIHAYKQGIRRFELDVQLTKDGQLIVIHDQTLERTTGVATKVKDANFSEIEHLDARKNTAAWSSHCHIPTLTQVVNSCPDVEHWQFEVKTSSKDRLNILCNRLVEYIQANKLNATCVVTSSNTWFLKELRRRDPSIKIGFVAEYRFPKPINTAKALGCEYLCLNYTLCSENLAKETHKLGIHLSCWTVNNIHEMLQLRELGVDSIITDFPTSAMIYFENNGLITS
ncbi:glycerophosphodiester phosphodiesterase [Alkalimarinus alittae]|uniref:Glycerophosphodiester phosphodiesterase n=1 Tax=Alkalimarinus alittae TaxID=2961619 RepID=A0ABY6MY26_9ALTE|nr:glycerophosphodiester phosphodiesterase [Alkalimarinus alittae]UZE94731.1 glycerophosphodiester phosphodiesterase [Alkalimarinus alittae]